MSIKELIIGLFVGCLISALVLMFQGLEIPRETTFIILTVGIFVAFPVLVFFGKALPKPVKDLFTKELSFKKKERR